MEPKSTLSSPLSSIDEPVLPSPWPAPKPHEGESPPTDSSPSAKRGRTAARGKRKSVARRPVKKPKWDAETIITDSNSPLGKSDLRSLLSTPMAWDVLNQQERAEILALFPDKKHVLDAGSDDARPNVLSLMNDDTFRHDCASYTENVSSGRFDPQWLAEAWAAQEARKMGDFDEYLVKRFEETWSVDLPEDLRPKRGTMNGPSTDNVDSKDSMSIEQDKMDLQEQTGHEEEDHSASSSIQSMRAPADDKQLIRTPGKCKGERLDAEDKMAIDELQVETKETGTAPLDRETTILYPQDGSRLLRE